ncbi:hypothetical protein EAG_13832 [Camponotus floridanus]|uniref:CCHC-type domain-containing protein n=1 Tax=Camponotus floridanus TaxID=104421 RepID=E2AXS6_CAMFO|nr:hypothetical protein EAG_13832 [Camponotus floridanus]
MGAPVYTILRTSAPRVKMSDEELLEVSTDTMARPDSPMDQAKSRAPSGSHDTPHSRGRDFSREDTGNSAMTAYNIAVQTDPNEPKIEPDSSTNDRETPVLESPWDSPKERHLHWSRRNGQYLTGPHSPEDPDPPEGCWNCGSGAHFTRECPHAKSASYCFRCNTRGYTVRPYPYCRSGWLAQGSYVRGRSHLGSDPPRGRRVRSNTRLGPY